MTLLSADDITFFQSEFDRFRVEVARPLAEAKQTTFVEIWRSPPPVAGKTAAPALHAADIPAHLSTPTGQTSLALLADLGGARASHFGELRYNADVTEADQIRIGDAIYIVERAVVRQDLTLCALSELKP